MRFHLSCLIPATLLALNTLSACGGQTGEEGASCDPVDTTILAMGDVSALGFSGDDVAALVSGDHAATLSWNVGGAAGVTVSVTPNGSVSMVDYEIVSDGSGTEAAIDCEDAVEMGVTLTLTTDDGKLDESFDGVLSARVADDVRFTADLALDQLGGSYAVTSEVDTARFEEIRAWVYVAFDSGGWRGTISGQGSGTDPSDSDVAFAENFEIASWNTAGDL